MADLKDVIKSLVQQCNIESISTKDLTKELSSLYDKVLSLEQENKNNHEVNTSLRNQLRAAEENLAKYKTTHVDPVDKIKTDREAFEKEKFKFDVEKEFLKKEVDIYKELTRSLTCTVQRNENWYGGNSGGSWSKGESADKPVLPGTGSQVKMP